MPYWIARSFRSSALLVLALLGPSTSAFAVTTGFFVGGDPDATCARYNMQPIEVQHTCIGCAADFVGATPADIGKQFCPFYPPADLYAYGTYTPTYVYPGGTSSGVFHCIRKYDGASIAIGAYNTYYRCTDACSLSLTLGSDNGNAGLGETQPGGKITGLYAEVACNGEPKPDIDVTLKVEAKENSGGHQHHAGRPTGTINGAPEVTVTTGSAGNALGRAYFEFGAPIVSGDHRITARCAKVNCGGAEGEVWAGVRGLERLQDSAVYILIGDTLTHFDNHYLEPRALQRITVLAALYRGAFPQNPLLHLNDASLERGGTFDVPGKWAPPHFEHCRGTEIDIRGNDALGAIPSTAVHQQQFQALARKVGASSMFEVPEDRDENPLPHLRHYHVRLLGGKPKCP